MTEKVYPRGKWWNDEKEEEDLVLLFDERKQKGISTSNRVGSEEWGIKLFNPSLCLFMNSEFMDCCDSDCRTLLEGDWWRWRVTGKPGVEGAKKYKMDVKFCEGVIVREREWKYSLQEKVPGSGTLISSTNGRLSIQITLRGICPERKKFTFIIFKGFPFLSLYSQDPNLGMRDS